MHRGWGYVSHFCGCRADWYCGICGFRCADRHSEADGYTGSGRFKYCDGHGRRCALRCSDGLYAAGAAAALFLFFKYQRRGSQCLRVYIQPVFVFCDALGLGIFSVTGTDMGIASGYGEHLVLCVCLGTLTGVGGGILRDIMCADIPAILCRNIYAAAALLGSSIFYLLVCVGASRTGAGCAAVFCTVALRLLAWHCHWNLPRAAKDQPSSPEQRKEETAVGRET